MGMVLLYSPLMEPLTIVEAAQIAAAEFRDELGPAWTIDVNCEMEPVTPYTPCLVVFAKEYKTPDGLNPDELKTRVDRYSVELSITEERVLSNVVNPKVRDENILIDRGAMKIGTWWQNVDYTISRGGVIGIKNTLQKIVNRIDTVIWLTHEGGKKELTDTIVKAIGRKVSDRENTTRRFERNGIQCELDLSHLFSTENYNTTDRLNPRPSLMVTLRAKSRIINNAGQFKWLQIGTKNLITYGTPKQTLRSAEHINEWIDRCLSGFEGKEQRFIERKRRNSCSSWQLSS